jgi:Fe-S-cluster-containing dehydrogenase component/DMSO reductase anchor subunit
MTRWAMIADLNRCIGCQTCTAACKHANATAPGVQWRRALDIEAGEFPDVARAFVPVGCMHCEDPPCVAACPTGATTKREDGIVVIDYDLCIGCAYCAVACPYQARFKVTAPNQAYGRAGRMRHERAREMPERINVAQKCTFCTDRIDAGLARGLTPGRDPEATPACANACIADALVFGDLDDPESRASQLLESHESFTMHDELGTGPGFHYLWAPKGAEEAAMPAAPDITPDETGLGGVAPWHQISWDWRAAANFIFGGMGSGLILAGAGAGIVTGGVLAPALLAGLALVALGLLCVWAEIGRPWRFLNVFRNPATSWMSREALIAVALFAAGGATLALAWWGGPPAAVQAGAVLAAALALAFLYAQARIIRAAKGIPLWREPTTVTLIVATGLAEGAGLALLGAALGLVPAPAALAFVLALLLGLRLLAWHRYRAALARTGAPARGLDALDRMAPAWLWAGHAAALALLALGLLVPLAAPPAFAAAGLIAAGAGAAFKFILITRAAFNQGFAIPRMPRRGAGRSRPGIKPGWRPGAS